MGEKAQVIEATAKRWKLFQVVGLLVFFASVVWWAFLAYEGEQASTVSVILATIVGTAGLATWGYGRFLGWWNHG